MIQAAALVQALETPAALVDADGTVVAANTAFEASGAAMTAGRLAQGACRETLGASGELIAWKVLPTEGGALLLLGQAVTPATDARAHHLAALSHELRTPLNGVLGMAALLSDTKLTAEQKAYLGSLRDCGEHLLGLVNDVLDLARLDAGKVTLHPAPTEVRRLLQTVVESLSPKAHAKGLEIAWTAPAEVPVILADEGRLRQILFNLAGNAVKFTETGGVLLSVEQALGAASEGAVTLRFVVTDTGPGVPAAQHERIFEAFAQADPNHAKRTPPAWAAPSSAYCPPPRAARPAWTVPRAAARASGSRPVSRSTPLAKWNAPWPGDKSR
jgi:signal transduction histidine kinase